MNVRAISLALLLLLASGCTDSPDDTGNPQDSTSSTAMPPIPIDGTGVPVDVPPGQVAWRLNETLAATGCQVFSASLPGADRAWVEAQLPAGASLPGNAPPVVNLAASICDSEALGNRSVLSPSFTLLAHVAVERDGMNASFPLEFSTNDPLAASALQGWGIFSENITVTWQETATGTTIEVQGTTADYMFQNAPRHPFTTTPPPEELLIWGLSDVGLAYRMAGEADQAPAACVAMLAAGRLADAFPSATPCLYSVTSGSYEATPAEIR